VTGVQTCALPIWGGDVAFDTGSDEDALARYVAEKLPTFPQQALPGQFFSYNNAAVALLGRLVEVLADRPYRAALDSLVLDPLGLRDTTCDPERVSRMPHTDGHFNGPDGAVLQAPLLYPRSADPVGNLCSTIADQLRRARLHLGEGSADGIRLLTPATAEAMQAPQVPIPGDDSLWMGMNWFVAELPGLRVVTHSGDAWGHHSRVVLLPDRQFAFVLLTNAEPDGALLDQPVLTEALTQYLNLGPVAAQLLTDVRGRPPVSLPPSTLAQYAGQYTAPGERFVLAVRNGTLRMTEEPVELPDAALPRHRADPVRDLSVAFVKNDLALLGGTGGSPAPFLRRADGSVGWLGVGLPLIPRRSSG